MKKTINTHLSFALQVGSRVLDKYRILKILNNTELGFDYLVESIDKEAEKRIYIIKEFFPKECVIRGAKKQMLLKASLSTEELLNFNFMRKMFKGEAKNLTKISTIEHPNIVKLIEVLENRNNTTYMVIAYEEGVFLSEYLEKRKKQGLRELSNEEIYEIVNPLLDAVEHIYKLGIHHLDIKPENILIKADGSPLLIRFHASTIFYDEYSKKYRNVYTPEYASPEQIAVENISEVDHRSDIYSMGVLLYYLITDTLPPKAAERKKFRKDDPYVSLLKQDFADKYDISLLEAVDKALSISKKYRFKYPNHFKNAITSIKPVSKQNVEKERKTTWYIVGFIVSIVAFFLYFSGEDLDEEVKSKISLKSDVEVKDNTKSVLSEHKTVSHEIKSNIKENTVKVQENVKVSTNSLLETKIEAVNIKQKTLITASINEVEIQIDVKLPIAIGKTKIKVNGKEYSDDKMIVHSGETYEISIENPYYQALNVKRTYDELLAFPMQYFTLVQGKGKLYLGGLPKQTQIKVYSVEENKTKSLSPEIAYKDNMYEMIFPAGKKIYMIFENKLYKSHKTESITLEHGKALTQTYSLEKKDTVDIPEEILVPVKKEKVPVEENASIHKSDIIIEAKKRIEKKKVSKDKQPTRRNVSKTKKSNKVQKKKEPAESNTSDHVWYCNAKAIGSQKVSAKHVNKEVAQQMAIRECKRNGSGCKILNCFLLNN